MVGLVGQMTNEEKLREIQNSMEPLAKDEKWLIDRIKVLTEALEKIYDYSDFGSTQREMALKVLDAKGDTPVGEKE